KLVAIVLSDPARWEDSPALAVGGDGAKCHSQFLRRVVERSQLDLLVDARGIDHLIRRASECRRQEGRLAGLDELDEGPGQLRFLEDPVSAPVLRVVAAQLPGALQETVAIPRR